MKKFRSIFFLVLVFFICGCQKNGQIEGRYYVPKVFLPDLQDEPVMLTTNYATLDFIPQADMVDMKFVFKGVENGYKKTGGSSIDSFQIDLPQVGLIQDSVYKLVGDGIEGTITYTMNDGKTSATEFISREFSVLGVVNTSDPSSSEVLLSADILGKQISLSLQSLTVNEKEADFGQEGYPQTYSLAVKSRLFKNQSGHPATVNHNLLMSDVVVIPDGKSKEILLDMVSEQDFMKYTLTFEDGRVSVHPKAEGNDYDYVGLTSQVDESRNLLSNFGILYLYTRQKVSYSITPDIYYNAVIPEG